VTRVLDRLRREESGFTLIELLTASVVGIVIIGVAFGLLDATVSAFGSSSSRTDAAQRGRLAADVVGQNLRSPVCLTSDVSTHPFFNNTTAFVAASASSVTFWSDTTGSNFSGALPSDPNPPPVLRELTLTGGVLTETVRNTVGGAVVSKRELATDVQPVGSDLFTYYRLTDLPAPRTATVQLASPVAATDLDRIARVTISLDQRPRDPNDTKTGSQYVNDVYVRSIDSGSIRGGIRCVA
jgi:Tfp pilus assembly protein PilW